jgi:PKD repeat protein
MRSARDCNGFLRSVAVRALAALVPLAILVGCEKLPAIPNLPPTASFIYTPVSPVNAGETVVTFNASASRDPDGQIVSYIWNFGDGSAEQTQTGPTTTHVFPDTPATCLEITYAVLLTVVDDKGDRGSASQTVKVTELPAPTSEECTKRR